MNSRNPQPLTRARRQRGISIVEALVALVVIAVGMLGIAGLYLSSLQSSRSAKLRAQAVQLAGSLADRIRANRDAVMAYDTAEYGGAPTGLDCETRRCTPEQLAQDDLAEWIADIQGTLPGAASATGNVIVTDNDRPQSDHYEIEVVWREANSDIPYTYVVALSIENAAI
jgi:type IV pilus assembly protein PilV